jgi:hypothetical protein
MVHENVKNIELQVPLDDMMLTLRDAIIIRDQWRTSIDVDPLEAASASTTASKSHTAPGSIFPETQPDKTQLGPSPIPDQPCLSQPQTWSTPLPAPDHRQPPTAPPKMTNNVCAKSKPRQKSSKAKKGQATIAANSYDVG